jgi:ribonucleoside-diphosphate reductase alpha chain/ribonucleoside-triphosphate reductase
MVRRTSEIVLFDADDIEVAEAKSRLYVQVDGKWTVDEDIIHRKMSNNTISYKQKPTRKGWAEHLKKMRYSGEPGVLIEPAANHRRPNFHGINPCAEILLNNKGLCNLTTINVMAFVLANGTLDKKALLYAQRLSARASYRMTNVELELPKWDLVQKEERLAGVSLTGWQDMVNATAMTIEEQKELLQEMRRVAKEETKKLSEQIGANDSLLVTTVKPEGTLSQLPTVSSGLHYSHSPSYIRRVRINANDPIVKALEELGYPIFPEDGQKWETCNTKVVEFPVKSPNGRTKYDISAIEQLENYKLFMENYVDHNASITIHVREHEWEIVEQWVWDNWDDIVAISFLPLDDSFYNLLPYEAIDEDEYNRRLKEIEGARLSPEVIAKYEIIGEDFELDESCDSGACPVR